MILLIKEIFAFVIFVMFISSCTDYGEKGKQAAEEVKALVKHNPSDLKDINEGLDEILEKYKEYRTERDFEIMFERSIKGLDKVGFKKVLMIYRHAPEVKGNIPLEMFSFTEQEITIKMEYEKPVFSIRVPLYMGFNYTESFTEFEGYITLENEDNSKKNYDIPSHKIKDLTSLSVDEEMDLRVSFMNIIGTISDTPLEDLVYAFKEVDKITSVRLKVVGKYKEHDWGEEEHEGVEEDDEVEEVGTKEIGSNEIDDAELDRALKDYDEYITLYIKVLKKMKAGDMSAMADYPELMKKGQTATAKLSKMQGQMTAVQSAKFIKLQAKYMESMQNM